MKTLIVSGHGSVSKALLLQVGLEFDSLRHTNMLGIFVIWHWEEETDGYLRLIGQQIYPNR